MLFKKRCFCILCRRYKRNEEFVHYYENIGICRQCYNKLETTEDKTFEGGNALDCVISPFFYTGEIREAVKTYKFSGQWLYGKLFGEVIEAETKHLHIDKNFDIIIPVPLHPERIKERGYNQSEIMAREIGAKTGLEVLCDALFRIKETEHQSRLLGKDRIENVRNAFYAPSGVISGKRILLVDDICTMGETLKACADACKTAGAKYVAGITLCITKEMTPKIYNNTEI